jgi:hypothetical protein
MRKICPLSNSGKPTALGSVTKAEGRMASDGRGLDVDLNAGGRGRLAGNSRCPLALAIRGGADPCLGISVVDAVEAGVTGSGTR